MGYRLVLLCAAGFGLCLIAAAIMMSAATPAVTLHTPSPPPPGASPGITLAIGPESPRIVLEAESGTIAAPMEIFQDADASGGKYVMTPELPNTINGTRGGLVELAATTAEAGKYNVWLRVRWAHSCDNSLWAKIGRSATLDVTNNTYEVWQWMRVGNEPFDLEAGRVTLQVGSREDGSKFDEALITSDLQYVPTVAESGG